MADKTPLYHSHLAQHAKIVDFHGWLMPIQYASPIQEHQAVRATAGIFDVSHMTVLDISGTDATLFLQKLLTNDVAQLSGPGKALYSCMCNASGGILDDLIVYWRAPQQYRLILNSATREQDLAWIQTQSATFAVTLTPHPELSIIAVQGPLAISKLCALLSAPQVAALQTLQRFECTDVKDWFIARTGYTGEDGVEIILPSAQVVPLWDRLTQAGFMPCGLAARDSLRLEAGYLLYGQDMDLTTTPLESGLAWTIKWQPADRAFIGMSALLAQKPQLQRKLVGLSLDEPGIMRADQRVVIPGLADGIITSGGYAPSLQKSIALARVPLETGSHVQVEIRGKLLRAIVGPPRFYTFQQQTNAEQGVHA